MKYITSITLITLLVAAYIVCNNSSQTITLDIKPIFRTTEQMPGIYRCCMYASAGDTDKAIGSISFTYGGNLLVFTTPEFNAAVDITLLPGYVQRLITVVKHVYAHNDLNKIVMLGDLYIAPESRGKKYAQYFVEHICQQLVAEGFTTIVLIPDPFEYENGQQKTLED